MENLNNSRILITGGTGSLGQALTRRLLDFFSPERVVIFSRDEHKQMDMQRLFPECDYYLGDIRDKDRLALVLKHVDYVFHAAALKVVPKGESDPFEFIKTNVYGAMNLIECVLNSNVKKVAAVSTDKACNPVNLYGATKLCSDKLFQSANTYNKGGFPRFSIVRYGNVIGSKGSFIPFFKEKIAKGEKLPVTDLGATRFLMTMDEAVDLVIDGMLSARPGEIRVPVLRAATVESVVYALGASRNDVVITGLRPGEKLHETLEGSSGSYDSSKADIIPEKELKALLNGN